MYYTMMDIDLIEKDTTSFEKKVAIWHRPDGLCTSQISPPNPMIFSDTDQIQRST